MEMKHLWFLLLGCCLIMSLVSFSAMGMDKNRAKKEKWRIPEARLFLFALLGGGVGGWLGMRLFHHKTKHWYFAWGFPLIALAQLGLLAWLALKLGVVH